MNYAIYLFIRQIPMAIGRPGCHILFVSMLFFCSCSDEMAFSSQKTINDGKTLHIEDRRELFVDTYLIEKLDNVDHKLNTPVDRGPVLYYDEEQEVRSPAYVTVLKDDDIYRLYYRAGKGLRRGGKAYTNDEWTCYAESKDGINWEKPSLGLFEYNGSYDNNIVLAGEAPVHHNFSPFIDKNPNVVPAHKYKAIGGTGREKVGLIPYSSPDGIHWKKYHDEGVITDGAFDSQNVAFWSESENRYVCYFRVFSKDESGKSYRAVRRATSSDFIYWSDGVEMTYGDTPSEHLYIQQTSPYFRAPHIYVAIGARLLPDRKIGSDNQLEELGVHSTQFLGLSEPYFMTSRGGNKYDRTFMESLIKPGVGLNNWSARSNFPALNVVQTSSSEMSLYVNQDYTQHTSHLRRYSFRIDGFTSITAPYDGGEFTTKLFEFKGQNLEINYATAAAGSIKVEIQDAEGKPIQGYAMYDSDEIIGNEIKRVVTWNNQYDVSALNVQPIRLKFYMKDADLYSLKFNQ